ncbi:hypothetical protein M378DRAFT_16559 [Amanita muscaria Koide BX008]|uniref:Eukaryotic translation initiation factor 3 subunit E N-terminal domain-containing protein n=1 Tax=Amanita muscaria (strain Koide BX008) TaxID=946122 RepID=A0A0C2SSQ6_AMAMK|nr:hypothetical protein M378DRAFT_16559 [Amanita muscaria Koide BX008]
MPTSDLPTIDQIFQRRSAPPSQQISTHLTLGATLSATRRSPGSIVCFKCIQHIIPKSKPRDPRVVVSLLQKILDDPVPPEEKTNEVRQKAQAVLQVIEKPEVAQSLRQDKIQDLKDQHDLTLEQITALYNLGQFQISYGNYSGAADYLYHFRVPSAHWGKLASDILTGNWEVALEELNTLREAIDSRAAA